MCTFLPLQMSQPSPDRDGWDLVQEIRAGEQRLGELDRELKDALYSAQLQEYRLLVVKTRLRAIEKEIQITQARLIAKQSMLKALPR